VMLSFLAAFPGYLVWLLVNLFVLDWQGAELTFASLFKPILTTDGEIRVSLLCVTLCLLSHWICHPIFLLTSCESGETGEEKEEGFFRSSNTVRSVFQNPLVWLSFYCVVFPVTAFLSCYVYSYFLYGLFLESLFWSGVLFVSFLLAGSVALVLYFRLLGRLAWVIETESRK